MIQRERERENDIYISICIYVYMYICIQYTTYRYTYRENHIHLFYARSSNTSSSCVHYHCKPHFSFKCSRCFSGCEVAQLVLKTHPCWLISLSAMWNNSGGKQINIHFVNIVIRSAFHLPIRRQSVSGVFRPDPTLHMARKPVPA